MNIPLVAIIGLPNVGKSTFFNKVLEQKKALVYPEAGTTRDRHYGLTSWNGVDFYLVDTAGLARPGSELEQNIQKQSQIAIDEADIILLLVDGKTLPANKDFTAAQRLSQSKKPIMLVANKIDVRNAKTESIAWEYVKLGLGQPFLVSSVNGSGIGDLLDAIVEKLKLIVNSQELIVKNQGLRIAFIGKPNVGKSSLINALLKQERLLVDSKAGTTRSTVDVPFLFEGKKFLLLDTAGIKRKWKQESDVATAAAIQSLRAIGATDIALFVLDVSGPITVADQAVAANILEHHKPAVVLLNKIDLVSENQRQKVLDLLPNYFPQLWYCPVIFTSAKSGTGLNLALEFAIKVNQHQNTYIEQDQLDKFLQQILNKHKPGKISDQRAPKVYHLKQIGTRPPTFELTVNFPAAIAEAWKRFFEKQFRLKFGFEGTPIEVKYIRKQ